MSADTFEEIKDEWSADHEKCQQAFKELKEFVNTLKLDKELLNIWTHNEIIAFLTDKEKECYNAAFDKAQARQKRLIETTGEDESIAK